MEEEEVLLKDKQYFREGIDLMLEHDNCGYLPAFPSEKINQKGVFFRAEEFKELLDDFEISANINLDALPEDFSVFIKYSPISLFKHWIFTISNADEVKISERSAAFEKDFFFLIIDDFPHLFSVMTNIAHESFLVNLYQRDEVEPKMVTFSTFLQQGKKLVVYKDYKEKKVSMISLKKAINSDRMHQIQISLVKTEEKIKYNVRVRGVKEVISHAIRLKKVEKKKESAVSKEEMTKVLQEYRKETISILEKLQGKSEKINKHANLSLGRVNKVPILINLPKKYADEIVGFTFDAKKEILTISSNKGKTIKSFKVAPIPKSNWLEVI